jgi:nicotinate-nucleotide adenylyltransferase
MDTAPAAKIGLLGGTFNPIHFGHLLLAASAVEAYDLGKVLFVPCGTPAHKEGGNLLPGEHRLAMVQTAIEGDLRFEALDLEIRRGGVSYAIDTVAELRKSYGRAELFFIIGSDTLPELHLWRSIYSLLTLCRFATFCRPGVDPKALAAAELHLDAPWPHRLLEDLRVGRQIEISSSEIRYRVAEGMSIRYLVPREVEMYVAEHGLYR